MRCPKPPNLDFIIDVAEKENNNALCSYFKSISFIKTELPRDSNKIPIAPTLPFKLPPLHLSRFSIKKKKLASGTIMHANTNITKPRNKPSPIIMQQ